MGFDLERLLTPLGVEAPCGADLTSEREYSDLLLSIPAPRAPQRQVDPLVAWRGIRARSVEFLESGSKDLRVAVLLTRALVNIEGVTGLVEGLALIRGLLERYGADLHPRAVSARGIASRLRAVGILDDAEGALRELEASALGGPGDLRFQDLAPERLDAIRAEVHNRGRAWLDRIEEGLKHIAAIEEAVSPGSGAEGGLLSELVGRLERARGVLAPELIATQPAAEESPGAGSLLDSLIRKTKLDAKSEEILDIKLCVKSLIEQSETGRRVPALKKLFELQELMRRATQDNSQVTSQVDRLRQILSDTALELRNPLDENVQFTVFRPRAVPPERWMPLLAFVHLSSRSEQDGSDTPDPVAEVRRQAEQILGGELGRFDELVEDTARAIPRGGEITLVPELPGLEVNPPRQTFLWLEPVHREEFRIRAGRELEGQRVRGRLRAYLGPVIIAEVSLNILVESRAVEDAAQPPYTAEHAFTYRKIFASYSHADTAIVEACERTFAGIGDRYIRDVVSLRSGEEWSPRIGELIEEADVFQLFWSSSSMLSRYVRQEWEHALALKRDHFVRPVYWEQPLPARPEIDLPPAELRRFHFTSIPWLFEASRPAERAAKTRKSPKKLLARTRKPRVHLEYEVETGGASGTAELPFVIAVLADLSGQVRQGQPELEERGFVGIDRDNFEAVFQRTAPSLRLEVPVGGESQAIELAFECLEDFDRPAVERKLEAAVPGTEVAATLERVLGDARFQRLESSWLGLHLLVVHCETSERLRISVLDLTRDELLEALSESLLASRGAWLDQLMTDGRESDPFGLIVGDFEFDHSPADTGALAAMARLAASIQAPFVGAASPLLLGLDAWSELAGCPDVSRVMDDADHGRWQELRDRDDAMWIALTLPRVLARAPSEAELARGSDGRNLAWTSAAYAVAVNVARSFLVDGWPVRFSGPEQGGRVEGFPRIPPSATTDGQVSSAEALLGPRLEFELSREGLVALTVERPGDEPVLLSMPSVKKPTLHEDERDAMAERLMSQLPRLFPLSRLAHYVRQLIVSRGHEELEATRDRLGRWLAKYVQPGLDARTPMMDARFPFREGRIELAPVEGTDDLQATITVVGPVTMDVPLSMVTLNRRGPRRA